jgi:S1-C subfamily serine protease
MAMLDTLENIRTKEDAQPGGTLRQINADLGGLANRVRLSLVRVVDGGRGAGAGVVLHERGLIVTNAHVAHRRNTMVEDWQARQLPARLIALDRRHDLAALSVEAEDLEPLELGDSQGLAPGSWLLAMGHPFGVLGGTTAGVAIGVGGDLPEAPPGREWLAMSLQLRPGHSGGPVIDTQGRLLGVNAMMAGPVVGLAVPAHVVKRFLKEGIGNDKRDKARLRRQPAAAWF